MNQALSEAPKEQMPGPRQGATIPKTRRLARLAGNSLANLARLGTGWIILLIVPPLLVRELDSASYAAWMLVLQIGAYATVFDGGLQLAIGRFVARAEHADEPAYLSKLLSSAGVLLSGVAVIVCVGVAMLSGHLESVFRSIPHAIAHQAAMALLIVGGALSVAIPSSVLAGLCLGLEKNHINAAASGGSKLAATAGTLWAAFHHQGLVTMALWTAAGTMVQPIIFVLASHRFGALTLLKIRHVSLDCIREFGAFGSATMASQFSMLLISGLDLPVVAAYDFGNAGYYALAITVCNMLVVPHGAVLSTMVPMLSSMSAVQEPESMGRALLRATRLATALLVLVATPLMAGLPVLLRLWVGADYARHILPLGELLIGAQFVRLTMMPYSLTGFSAGEQSRMLVSPAVESMVNLGCSLVLVRSMGAAGVAVGTLIGAVVGVVLHFAVSMAKTRSIAIGKWTLLRQGILQPIGWALAPTVSLALILPLVHVDAMKLALLAGTVVALAAVFWRWHLNADDRMAFESLRDYVLSARNQPKTMGA